MQIKSALNPSSKIYVILAIALLFSLVIDYYVYEGIKVVIQGLTPTTKWLITYFYWGITCFTVGTFGVYSFFDLGFNRTFFRRFLIPFCFINYFSKLFVAFFLLLDDVIRGTQWAFRHMIIPEAGSTPAGTSLSRSVLLTQIGIAAAAIPVITMGYGIISGAHNYTVRRVKVKLPHLPSAFHGLRIGQLSDIHSGSFFNKESVKRGITMLLQEKPDMIFFTGDLVNNKADEVHDYLDVFNKIQAPLGVYTILGNHDYGDYMRWPSPSAKYKNYLAICAAHKQFGWNLLMNAHKIITQGSDQLAVLGVENWGTGGFSQYGKLDQAYHGTQDLPIKLLLSHDPSHWDAEVRPHYQDIDITFSGHTHGFQLGIEVGVLKWSPAQYKYKQWAGLYQAKNQYLYVNRGYGYIGYPGRIGIAPEITIMELEKA